MGLLGLFLAGLVLWSAPGAARGADVLRALRSGRNVVTLKTAGELHGLPFKATVRILPDSREVSIGFRMRTKNGRRVRLDIDGDFDVDRTTGVYTFYTPYAHAWVRVKRSGTSWTLVGSNVDLKFTSIKQVDTPPLLER